MNGEIKEKVKECILEAIQEKTKEAFLKSQQVVPVVTGNLKRSGDEENIENGAIIKYKAEYASQVERGVETHYEQIDGHYTKKGKWVKTFNRLVKSREGRKYIEKPLRESFNQFGDALKNNLKEKFKRVV